MADVEVWWAGLSSARVGLEDLLDTGERTRLAGLDLPADRARFLLGAALLRTAAGRAVGMPPDRVEIDRSCAQCGEPHGAPRVAGGPHLSVSHSGVLVVVAVCVDAAVGVDVQRVSDLAGRDAVSWTRQEARFKACGTADRADSSTTIELEAPLPGYAAALTIATTDPPRVHVVADQLLARRPGRGSGTQGVSATVSRARSRRARPTGSPPGR